MKGAHRRYNPLLGEWVLCSPGRLDRPWQGERQPPPPRPPAHDDACDLSAEEAAERLRSVK